MFKIIALTLLNTQVKNTKFVLVLKLKTFRTISIIILYIKLDECVFILIYLPMEKKYNRITEARNIKVASRFKMVNNIHGPVNNDNVFKETFSPLAG